MEPEKKSKGALLGSIVIIIIVVIAAILLFRSNVDKTKESAVNGNLDSIEQELDTLNFDNLDIEAEQ